MSSSVARGDAELSTDRKLTASMRLLVSLKQTTMTELGEIIGINKSTMSRRQNFGGWTAAEIARAAEVLRVDIATLYGGVEGLMSQKADLVELAKPIEDQKSRLRGMKGVRREGIEPPTRWMNLTPSEGNVLTFPERDVKNAPELPNVAPVIPIGTSRPSSTTEAFPAAEVGV